MSDGSPAAAAGTSSAGRLLREARERQGLHIVALAAMIKVTPKKLEMLEADRLDALPDATFARALAQTVCRALKIDPSPVLALLPVSGHRLDQVGRTLNTPFRERPGALVQRDAASFATSPAFWITGLILLAAVTVYLLPSGIVHLGGSGSTAASAPSPMPASAELPGMPPDASASAALIPPLPDPAVPSTAEATAAATGTVAVAVAASAGAAPAGAAAAPTSLLQLKASANSWVEVTDARGQALVSRVLLAGETIDLDGVPPLQLRIGNAAATRVVFRGQATDVSSFTRDNVARLELK